MRILYVEDDPFDADLTRRALQRTAPHFSLTFARSQNEAMSYLEQAQGFDLLLTDLRLPDGSGFALLSHVREQQLPLAVVVITGGGDEEIAVSALKAGANDYLVKRQNYLDHLWVTLENAQERYQAEQRRRERPLSLLYLDNHLNDIEATQRHFAAHAPHIHIDVVYGVREMLQRLPAGAQLSYDALMVDYHQQELGALDLLKELRQMRGLDLPIVLVTARGDEEIAAQALRLGASDYVVKSPGYLFGLPGLMENAYHRAQLEREQQALQASEARFRRLAENAPDVIYRARTQPELAVEYISPAAATISGYSVEELQSDLSIFMNAVPEEDLYGMMSQVEDGMHRTIPITFRFRCKDGRIIWLEGRNVAITDGNGVMVAHEGIVRDITERKRTEEQIQRQLERLNALRTIDTAITGNLGLQNTLSVLLDHVLLQLGADAAGMLLYNPATERLEYSASKGFRSDQIPRLYLPYGAGPAGRAIRAGQTIQISCPEELDDDLGMYRLWEKEGIISYYGSPLVAKGDVVGVLEVYHRTESHRDAEWLSFLNTLAGQAAIAIENARLLENLQQANLDLTKAYDATLEGWVGALDLRDRETQDHTLRVTELTLQLAQRMGFPEEDMIHLRRGTLLHDIGKMGISDSILHKPGPLNDEEMAAMKRHPDYAYQLLSKTDYLNKAIDIPYCHHEKWDGSGYPRGLKGNQIPLAARIFAVVDVYDALISDRPYRSAWDPEKAISYIRDESGRHFDPEVVRNFLELLQAEKEQACSSTSLDGR